MINERYKKTLAAYREVYNELYYLGKDLSLLQRSWLKRRVWRALKRQIRRDAGMLNKNPFQK